MLSPANERISRSFLLDLPRELIVAMVPHMGARASARGRVTPAAWALFCSSSAFAWLGDLEYLTCRAISSVTDDYLVVVSANVEGCPRGMVYTFWPWGEVSLDGFEFCGPGGRTIPSCASSFHFNKGKRKINGRRYHELENCSWKYGSRCHCAICSQFAAAEAVLRAYDPVAFELADARLSLLKSSARSLQPEVLACRARRLPPQLVFSVEGVTRVSSAPGKGRGE